MTTETNNWMLGIDVGGTFTDLTALDSNGALTATKTPSTPDPSDGVIQGIEKMAGLLNVSTTQLLERCTLLVHGTTVATNTILEYNGAKVGLITTEGFRDEIEFRRGYKESVFSPRLPAPYPIVPRRLRIGVPERLGSQGETVTPLDENAVREAIRFFKAEQVEAVAVCFLFSFLNPAHERRVKEIIGEEAPEMFVSLSCEVLPQIREFERVSTTIVNAYTAPSMKHYLERLESRLREQRFAGELFVMQSSGGVQNIVQSGQLAASCLLSGPAGGVTAAAFIGERIGYKDLITVDMGGTSYDVSVIEQLQPTLTTESWISRFRVALPMLDIHTVGAGGGSIAWIDSGGLLQVGPRSAGSTPGPACYGRGGTEPTVTDANVVLGYINPDHFLGGEMKLDRSLSEQAIRRAIAEPLGISVIEAALAISEIVNNNMSNAIRFVTTQRGYDPRRFALLAAGGAGALHAGRQAEDLGIDTVIVPGFAPVLCALGDVAANLKVTELRTFYGSSANLKLDEINSLFDRMEQSAREKLGDGGRLKLNMEVRKFVDMRYAGEVHEVTVPIRTRTRKITDLNMEATIATFHDLHERLYAHKDTKQEIEILNLRLDLVGVRDRIHLQEAPFGEEDPSAALVSKRQAYFGPVPDETSIYDGAKLVPGNLVVGPAIIEQWGTTIVVYPGHEALIDANGNCIIEVRQGREAV
ncbi:hydantoinase/oxoprolinase family protein [Cohnella thailandensis]|uniref:Hydantoinase/oxoprolinase family protein n=1 Tax=Cohnella thailandensis TaxID=557557 RepID=A0A841T3W2_9BACL|nr:hydantoinase/oxoprolinase family protein [Cohnella thailandensis]MBB6637526.1 hydantoinase/oxoprolinase family protein [Cohnella thailandensis]MBP1977559.1 N-methylhydantoinase A [Cohnella thailandensis]